MVEVKETGQKMLTDSAGVFNFTLNDNILQVTLIFTAINYKQAIIYTPIESKVDVIFADVGINTMDEFVIKGFSARQVVEKAVAQIPHNYLTKSYFAYSFYRDYEQINGVFTNLTEAKVVVMNRLNRKKQKLQDSLAFAVTLLRRAYLRRPFKDFMESEMGDIFNDDPVYHLEISSLNPAGFNKYSFHFDTSAHSDDYVINYFRPDFTSEAHGIARYSFDVFWGEAVEKGQLIIDRNTFAIKKIIRKAVKNPGYDYGGPMSQINIIQPSHRYFFRFVEGEMVAEYEKDNDRWHLSRLMHQYTNDFYQTVWGNFQCRVTEYTEWYCDSVSRYVDGLLADHFYPSTWFYKRNYNYDSLSWADMNYPFWFVDKDKVYRDISRAASLEKQFKEEGARQPE